jgi:tetratricopeptide (TPR) repeat protein
MSNAFGPYTLERQIGSGGMGSVWLASRGEERFALKIVHPHLLDTEGFAERFRHEARIGQEVSHPNVVRTLDCDTVGDQRFLVMEYVEGQTLRDLLTELRVVPEDLCRHVAREVAKGLVAIHEAGVVHRDLKPENVLISEDHVVKVMDLGVSRLLDNALRLSQSGAFVGSVRYAAPEQFHRGGEQVDERCDLHGLGLVLYELATGRHPFEAGDITETILKVTRERPRRLGELQPQLSAFFEEAVHTLLEKDREQRFGSAREAQEVFEKGEGSSWWQRRSLEIRDLTRRPLRRSRILRETAVHGRKAELADLRARYERAKGGEGQVVLIEGEAGIGKSRLVDELLNRLQRDGEDVNFLLGGYPPGGAATASGAFSTAFREQFGGRGSAGYLPATPRLVPAFDALLRGESSPASEAPLTRDSLQTCFIWATRTLAEERPTILLIDDLHYAPEEGLALFAALASALPGHRVLLIGAHRPGLDGDWVSGLARLDQTSRLALSRLGPRDLVRLLEDTLRSRDLASRLAGPIGEKSDGNPFFVFEILRGLRDGGFLTCRPDGTWATTGEIVDIEIPSSVQDLVHARLANLTEEEKDILEVAACFGFEFDPVLVATAAGLPVVPALRLLGHIERQHRLVRSAGRHLLFDHHNIHQVLYDGLLVPLRERYHGAIATALEEREGAADGDPGALDGAKAHELCRHHLLGGNGERALRYLDGALDHLESGYLHADALALAGRALEEKGLLAGRARVLLLNRVARAAGAIGGRDEELAALEEALPIADELGDPALRGKIQMGLAARAGNTWNLEEAEAFSARALELAREAGDRAMEAAATRFLGTVCERTGRYEACRERYEACLALWTELEDRRGQAVAENCLGSLLAHLGRFDEAERRHQRALEIAREIGDLVQEGISTGDLGTLHHELGRLGRAKDDYERCLELFRESGDRHGIANALANLGEVHGTLGDASRAREQMNEAVAVADEIGFTFLHAFRAMVLAEVAGNAGARTEAEERFAEALSLTRELRAPRYEADTLLAYGELLAREGRADEARERFAAALELAREVGLNSETVLATAQLAALTGDGGDEAAKAFAEHESELRGRDSLRARYALFRATGDRTHLREAHRLLAEGVEHAPATHRESMVENVPLHRDIDRAWREFG